MDTKIWTYVFDTSFDPLGRQEQIFSDSIRDCGVVGTDPDTESSTTSRESDVDTALLVELMGMFLTLGRPNLHAG